MAQLALAIPLAAGGAALGSTVGLTALGASVGLAAGQYLGQMLLSEEQVTEGPRKEDLSVQTATYGRAIPEVWGSDRMAGNIIWASDLIEERVSRSVGGKGKGMGGGGATQVSYKYFGNFAVAFCNGPVQRIRRVWADNKLIVDLTPNNTNGKGHKYGAEKTRFYLGTEDQNPDPLIEAYEGAGNVPAHRGIVYVVFDRLPLEDFGNRIPQIMVEVTAVSTESVPPPETDILTNAAGRPDGAGWGSDDGGVLEIDGPYLWEVSGEHLYKINRYTRRATYYNWFAPNADNLTNANEGGATLANSPQGYLSTPIIDVLKGKVYMGVGGSSRVYLAEFDRDTLQWSKDFNGDSGEWDSGLTYIGFAETYRTYGFAVYPNVDIPPYPPTYLVVAGDVRGPIKVLNGAGHPNLIADFARLGEIGSANGYGSDQNTRRATFAIDLSGRRFWAAGGVGAEAFVTKMRQDGTFPDFVSLNSLTGYTLTGRIWAISYDSREDALIVVVDREAILKIDPETFALIVAWDSTATDWAAAAASMTLRNALAQPYCYGVLYTDSQGDAYRFNTATMRLEREVDINALGGGIGSILNSMMYEPEADAFWTPGGGYALVFLERFSADAVTVGSIVADLCEDAGLEPVDYDVSALTDEVDGYTRTGQMTVRSAIQPLMAAYSFDAVETDWTLRFVKRGAPPAVTIEDKWLGADQGGANTPPAKIGHTRGMETEIPRAVTINYKSKNRNYADANQQARRIADTTGAEGEASVALPIVMGDQQAKDLAESTLARLWTERDSYETTLPPRFLALDPTDVVVFAKRGPNLDADLEARIETVEYGANGVLRLEATAHAAATYTPSAPAVTFEPVVETVPVPVGTKGFMWNGPVVPGIVSDDGGAYWAAGPGFAAPNVEWRGGVLLAATDAGVGNFANLRATDVPTPWFRLQTGLPAMPLDGPWGAWDDVTTVDVEMMTNATLASYPAKDVLAGVNRVVIGDEVVQFRDATLIDSGLYRLSGLLRGRLGTEWAMAEKRAGTAGFLIDPDAIERVLDIESVGQALAVKTVSVGEPVTVGTATAFTNTGAALKPWAPCQVAGNRDGSDNLTVTWTRRTRYGGQWLDGTPTVPLREESEAYEVDVLDANGAVVRTITGLSAPSATYSATDQTADGITPGDPVTVEVFQLSADVGRGYGRRATV